MADRPGRGRREHPAVPLARLAPVPSGERPPGASAHGRPVRLYTADGSTSYRGVLKSVPSSPGNRITVDVLPLETYLRGVVPAETYASVWHQQALRAQAVAARTYAVHERADRRDAVFDLCETEACQA